MKKKIITLVAFLSLFATVTSCGGNTNSGKASSSISVVDGKIVVTFDYNYEGAPAAKTVEIAKEDAVEQPSDPTRDNYAFTGWYEDKNCTKAVDFENALYDSCTYYAGWKKTAAVITFDLNYDGATSFTQVVEIGKPVTQPTTPEREGYIFDGWYKEKEGTNAFDFTAATTDDQTIYAKWNQDDGNNISITYLWNFGEEGTYDKVTIAKGKKTTCPYPTREGYYFEGWYTESDCVNKFDFTQRINESVTLYAHWMGIFTFEAEYTDLTGLAGMGYSGNADGVKMITTDTDGERGASNGYYVGWLYNNGLQLKFNIDSDAACDNAILSLSLSAEYYDITLTDSTFTVAVNGTALSYNDIEFVNAGTTTIQFASYLINNQVSLNEGENLITLTVTNTERKTGTIYASAPMVDCMTIYSDTSLSWDPKTSNIAA